MYIEEKHFYVVFFSQRNAMNKLKKKKMLQSKKTPNCSRFTSECKIALVTCKHKNKIEKQISSMFLLFCATFPKEYLEQLQLKNKEVCAPHQKKKRNQPIRNWMEKSCFKIFFMIQWIM